MPAQRALRLLLTRGQEGFTVDAAFRIEKLLPPSDPLEGAEREAGAWLALEDGRGRPLYRRHLPHPFGTREVFGDERPMRVRRLPDQTETLSVLVPELPEAEHLVIYASDVEGESRGAPAEAVFKLSMRQLAALASEPGAERGK